MKTLAELSFEYIWLLMFGTEDIIDLDYSVQCQESLATQFEGITEPEKLALVEVAVATRNRLLAEPGEHGYTPRKLVSEEQRAFLDAFISGEVFEQWL
jgi:hypothetical protein